jgi:uncharacterized protein (DUF488 family)
MSQGNAPFLYTAGYEGLSLDDLLVRLRAHGIRMLADVREAPISRKRGFSKNALMQALLAAGIEYRHIRALGCPKAIRDGHRADKNWDRYTCGFMAHLEGQEAAVAELAEASARQPTALLCYEADFNRCHRTYVARAVVQRNGLAIGHITAEGMVRDCGTVS